MDSLSIHRNEKNQNSFHIPILIKATNQGDYQATVPDVPKEKNNRYMEIRLMEYGDTKNHAVRSLSNNISQWLYERIDDGKPIPNFSTVDEIKSKFLSDACYNDSHEVRELIFYEEEILNIN